MLKISFDLDEITKKISNLKVVSINNEVLESATIEVLDNKLKLSKAAVDMLGAVANDKVTIKPFSVVSTQSWLSYGGYAMQKMLLPSSTSSCDNGQKILLSKNQKKNLCVVW